MFKDLLESVRTCMSLVEHYLLQLHLLINKKDLTWKSLVGKNSIKPALTIIGRLLNQLCFVDQAFQLNQSLKKGWNSFKSILNVSKADPMKYGSTGPQLKKLQKLVVRLDNTVLSGNLLNQVLRQDLEKIVQRNNLSSFGPIKANKQLKQSFKDYISGFLSEFA